MATADPYQTLGVTRSASQDEIKNAYRNLAKKFHPDLNPGNKSSENKFKEIGLAYEMIGSPDQRAKYDRGEFVAEDQKFRRPQEGPYYYQAHGNSGGERYTGGYSDLGDDFFESLFGRSHRSTEGARSGPLSGQDEIYQAEVDLKDTIHGAEKELTFPNGKRLSVKIPPGARNGTKLRLPKQGGRGMGGGPPGDAYIEIHIRPMPGFHEQGDNLMMELPISLSNAVLGGQIEVPTVDGTVLMKIPPQVNTDSKLKLSGKGLFNRKTNHRGDQIMTLKVYLPDPIDSELEEAIKKWSEKHPEAAKVRSKFVA